MAHDEYEDDGRDVGTTKDLKRIYRNLEDVPDGKWRYEEMNFHTYAGGFKYVLYGATDEYGNATETGVSVFDNDENIVFRFSDASGLSSVFEQLVKREAEALKKQKAEDAKRSRKKFRSKRKK